MEVVPVEQSEIPLVFGVAGHVAGETDSQALDDAESTKLLKPA